MGHTADEAEAAAAAFQEGVIEEEEEDIDLEVLAEEAYNRQAEVEQKEFFERRRAMMPRGLKARAKQMQKEALAEEKLRKRRLIVYDKEKNLFLDGDSKEGMKR